MERQTIQYSPLGRTGMSVSKLGFGCFQLGLVENGSAEEDEAVQVVIEAVKSGINYLDTAPWYGFGNSEVVLGKALKHLPRSSYYVATKVGRYHPEYDRMFDFSYARTLQSVDESLKKLGISYLDVVQVHDLEFAPSIEIILQETLPALQKVVAEGKARFIGITGYPLETLKQVILRSEVPIDLVLSYARWNLFDRTLGEYTSFFKERGIGIVNAAFLGMGLLTQSPLPTWHPAGQEVRLLCKNALEHCQKAEVDISKLATCFALKNDDAATHLIGFNSKEHLKKNLGSLLEGLNDKEEQVLKEILEKYFTSNHNWEGVEVQKYWRKVKSSVPLK